MTTLLSNSLLTPGQLQQSSMCRSLKHHFFCSTLQPIPKRALSSRDLLGSSIHKGPSRLSSSLRTPSLRIRSEQSEERSSVSTLDVGRPSEVSSMSGKSFLAKLGQSVNVAGITFSSKVILKERHLAIPHVSVPDISWIDWKALRDRGFEAVVFDKDNTLTAPYAQSIWPSLLESLEKCRATFSGRLALLSNSAGLYQFDPDGVEAKGLEERLGIHVIRHGSKKPSGNAKAVADHFACDPSRVVMVGDRYLTDIVYGNSNGMLTIRSAPLTSVGEPFVVRRVRGIEDALVNWWRSQGIEPTKHALYEHPVDFIKDPGFW
ncbi:hypothetical protein R1sor_020088 [Riccia sorocarpa]|uniref:Phosphatidylglycerophosphatase GEP4, mitochondrial n=1 Tax=Riccia sorocarpa TaxID=122646 RepID=A0ABD3IF12_9MARC